MSLRAWTKAAFVGAALTITGSDAAGQALPPPTNITVVSVDTDSVRLRWIRPSGFEGEFIDYLVEQFPSGEFFAIATHAEGQEFSVPPNTTFRLTFRSHLTSTDTFSERSVPVTFTTPAFPPVENLEAQTNGNEVTLSWSKPAVASGNAYNIFDNGILETVLNLIDIVPPSTQAPTTITLPRVQAGRTHVFTVNYPGSVGASVQVTIPGMGDTIPPTVPPNLVTIIQFDRDGIPFEVTTFDRSTDDVTPQDEITYELLLPSAFPSGPPEVENYSITSPIIKPGIAFIRAVDASGNRSALVPLPAPRR